MKKMLLMVMAVMGMSVFAHAQEVDGEKTFMGVCAACHGLKGEASPPSPEPINTLSQEKIEARLARARGDGPKGRMDRAVQNVTEAQAKAVAEYIVKNLRPTK
ncbi:MAG: c-type cytochrome [Saezia sp.]